MQPHEADGVGRRPTPLRPCAALLRRWAAPVMLAIVLCMMTATPAAAACAPITVGATTSLEPGEHVIARRTVALPANGSVMTAAEPVITGDLAAYLTAEIRWCEGSGCTPTTVLTPGIPATATASTVTFIEVVELSDDAPEGSGTTTVVQRATMTADTCKAVSGDADSSNSGDSDSANGNDVLAFTGTNLSMLLWGLSLVAVGTWLWAAARTRRAGER